jgi:hypothetical protein
MPHSIAATARDVRNAAQEEFEHEIQRMQVRVYCLRKLIAVLNVL